MTATQIKAEIDKLLEEIPENSLQSVLDLLHDIKSGTSSNSRRELNIRRIMTEDRELLKKLAE